MRQPTRTVAAHTTVIATPAVMAACPSSRRAQERCLRTVRQPLARKAATVPLVHRHPRSVLRADSDRTIKGPCRCCSMYPASMSAISAWTRPPSARPALYFCDAAHYCRDPRRGFHCRHPSRVVSPLRPRRAGHRGILPQPGACAGLCRRGTTFRIGLPTSIARSPSRAAKSWTSAFPTCCIIGPPWPPRVPEST